MFDLLLVVAMLGVVAVIVVALYKRFKYGVPAPVVDPNRLRIDIGHALVIRDGVLEYEHVYGKGFKVPLSAVQVATVEKSGWGKATLKVIGHGTELAVVTEIPEPWAAKAQVWIMEKVSEQAKRATV